MSISDSINQINLKNKTQTSGALLLQGYCNSILKQQNVDFSNEEALNSYQQQINDALSTAQGHARDYLNSIYPKIIKNLSNITNYFELHNAVPTSLPENATTEQWSEALQALQEESQKYSTQSSELSVSLSSLSQSITIDSGSFQAIVTALNSAVSGDDGVLEQNTATLASIQSKIEAEEAGVVLSGLGIIGAIFTILIGSVATLVTAGTSITVVAGGVAALLTSAAGETTAGVYLHADLQEKAALLADDQQMQSEVKIAMGISGAYNSLSDQMNKAIDAVQDMTSAWTELSDDLSSLASDLDQGITNTGELRTLWLTDSNSAVQSVIQDTNIIKDQMDGVSIVYGSSEETIDELVANHTS